MAIEQDEAMKNPARLFLPALLTLTCMVIIPASLSAQTKVPEQVNPDTKYLFYLHGISVELFGKDGVNPRTGSRYEYDKIATTFREMGAVVISEARPRGTRPQIYARKVAAQVGKLVKKGVKPENISVVGHSKGGMIAFFTATMVQSEQVKYVIMAGCSIPEGRFRRGYQRFLRRRASRLTGRFLSIYDKDDELTRSCREAFRRASNPDWEERVLETGKGHNLFAHPLKVWLTPVGKWVGLSN